MGVGINYQLLAEAIEFYGKAGYKYIEVPWVVPQWVLDITKPPTAVYPDIDTIRGKLVASAEQSYLNLISEGKLPPGNYMACTPCFRQGDSDGMYHQDHFMKVELINTLSTGQEERDLAEMIGHSFLFFSQYTYCGIIKTEEKAFDIVSTASHVELGSYGIREYPQVGKWIYGTGCAEPRFSSVLRSESKG